MFIAVNAAANCTAFMVGKAMIDGAAMTGGAAMVGGAAWSHCAPSPWTFSTAAACCSSVPSA